MKLFGEEYCGKQTNHNLSFILNSLILNNVRITTLMVSLVNPKGGECAHENIEFKLLIDYSRQELH